MSISEALFEIDLKAEPIRVLNPDKRESNSSKGEKAQSNLGDTKILTLFVPWSIIGVFLILYLLYKIKGANEQKKS